ncbi:PAS domain-containing protein [Phthorimaea operculella]|nr:PAS domain-containing protein [Phthorimaea operculella]
MDDDGDDKDDTKRRTRNLSEKKRRDQFNMLVNELSTMISTNNRKMDKSTVLKSTISFLKNHNEVTVRSRAHDVQEDWKPAFLSNEEFTYLVLEALEGFVMVFSASGQIYYVSESITSLLGHNPADVANKTIFDLVSEEDRPNLYNLLQNPTSSTDPLQTLVKNENEIRFQCNLRRGALDFREEATYELIQFNGHFRTNSEQVDREEGSAYQHENDSSYLFVCTCRLYTPQLIRDVSLVDSSRCEFTSRHSLEWKFLFLDHRAPPIIGYLPFEVLGTSGYDYYHFDDLEKVVTCHEALMRKGELTSCYYRFLTKGQQWIWLQTRFYITYHQWSSKPEFVVCTHRVVSYADVQKGMKQESSESTESTETLNPVEPEQSSSQGQVIKEQPADEVMVNMSPPYMADTSDSYSTYQPLPQPSLSKPSSVGSAGGTPVTSTTTSTSWQRSNVRGNGSDTSSLSGEMRSSQRNSRELQPIPASYTHAHTPDNAQMQEQLQWKHEQLQQMIVRQQEELRHVKEQLLLARLGMLQPVINVQGGYVNPEDLQAAQRVPSQIAYETGGARAPPPGYLPAHAHPHAHAQPPQPALPPHQQPPPSAPRNPHMPQ